MIAAFALAPAVHAANLSLFHPEILAVPALAGAALWLRQERWVRYWACGRGDPLLPGRPGPRRRRRSGVVADPRQRRPGGHRLGRRRARVDDRRRDRAATRSSRPRRSTAAQAFAASGTAPLAEARNLLTHPIAVLGDLFAQGSLPILVALLAPLLFLPLSAPRSLHPGRAARSCLGIAAGQAVQEAAEPGVPESTFGAAMAVVAVVPITVAGLVAISRIGRRSITRINVDHRIVASIVVASLILFVQNAPSSPYQQPWDWGGRDQVDTGPARGGRGRRPRRSRLDRQPAAQRRGGRADDALRDAARAAGDRHGVAAAPTRHRAARHHRRGLRR